MTQHRPGLARAQHVAVIDAVRPERHGRDTLTVNCAVGVSGVVAVV